MSFDISASADDEHNALGMSYTETGAPGSGSCLYRVTYTLTGVPSGYWQLEAFGSILAGVDVP